MTTQRNLPVVDVPLFDSNMQPAPFRLTFYGIPVSEFTRGDGGNRIRIALERRGFTGYVSSPLLIRERKLKL